MFVARARRALQDDVRLLPAPPHFEPDSDRERRRDPEAHERGIPIGLDPQHTNLIPSVVVHDVDDIPFAQVEPLAGDRRQKNEAGATDDDVFDDEQGRDAIAGHGSIVPDPRRGITVAGGPGYMGARW